MSLFNRFFSFIFGCLLVIAGVVTFTDGLGITYVSEALSFLWRNGIEGTITLFVGAFIFGLGIVILLANLCIKAPKAVRVPGGDKGNAVYITLNTIENMARNAAMAAPGVVSVNTKIKNKSKGLCLRVRISVSFDDNINEVTERLQRDIRTLIESSTSLTVSSVEVLVVKATGEKDAAAYRSEAPAKPEGEKKGNSREAIIPLNKGENQ
ncbi:MAG: alkaline shock response membrane anchor protein AmaP [Bacillota bacterium]|nr:alkaline shock response membrane anchor protein AmaP [Bacillota bacterium]